MLRVMTLNIWNTSHWRERREEIVAWVTHVEPDVLCLQEVVNREDGRNQAAWLAARTGRHWAGGPGLDFGNDAWFGNAVLSRWPIDAHSTTRLPGLDQNDEGRVLLHARTDGLDVFCTHLNWQYHHGNIREAQVLKVVATIEAQADPSSELPPIVCGDFNANPDSNEIRFMCGLATLEGRSTFFQDAWRVAGGAGPGHTWDNRNSFAAQEREPDGRIDYIFVGWRRDGGAGRIESARVVCDRSLTGAFASDHFGVLADIARPARA
jgi:endonuclease/exonuclease/phosphatase family metal-dependent hydrolase